MKHSETRNRLPEGALLDPEDIHLLEGRTWRIGNHGYVQAKSKGIATLLHRLVANPSPDQHVDHINHNTLDNRRANLRACTRGENLLNQLKRPGTSRFKGVYFYKRTKQWLARVSVKRKLMWSGYFETELDAAREVNKYIKLYHGEFAVLNVIGD